MKKFSKTDVIHTGVLIVMYSLVYTINDRSSVVQKFHGSLDFIKM